MPSTSLRGALVGITADRRHEEQALLLERHGARTLHGPVIRTMPLSDQAPLLEATQRLVRRPPDLVLLTTAVGARGWFSAAEAHGLGERLHAALDRAEVITRGPKAAGAAISWGLAVTHRATGERSTDLLEHVASTCEPGVRVAVQLDGAQDPQLPDALRTLGADVEEVRVYRWTVPIDPQPGQRLVEAVAERRIDAVTFTSAPAVSNFLDLAESLDLAGAVRSALDGPVVAACVGPVSAGAAEARGVTPLVPERSRLGPLVQALADRLREPPAFTAGGSLIALRRSAMVIDDEVVEIAAREREVLEVLAASPSRVVSKAELLRRVWGAPNADEHTVEVTVARLRRRLGKAGHAVQTTNRRGYRLVLEPAAP